jgi:hypothetical protein
MRSVTSAVSVSRLSTLGVAGLGAVVAAGAQTAGNFGLGDNVRDLGLVVLSALIVGMSNGGSTRAFGVGFGAAAVSSLIRRNVLTAV